MKSIAFVIPYFGKFPNYFSLWLQSCRNNPTIDWLLFTDSNEKYDYPKNVKVTLIQFGELRDKIQNLFDFEISLLKPYKLCDFRPSYGEIFKEQLVGYDYWGFCDIDLIWGDLRKFLTDDLLNNVIPTFGNEYFERIIKYNENFKISALYDNIRYSLTETLLYYISLELCADVTSLPKDLKIILFSIF